MDKFLALVQYGSFTEAARYTHVSQPALTSALKSLESRYGAQFIIRNTKPLQLTPAGRLAYESANRMFLEITKLTSHLKDIGDAQEKVAVGAIDSIAMRMFSRGVNIGKLEVHVDNSKRLIEAVRMEQIDIAFISEPLVAPAGNLTLQQLRFEPFSLVSHADIAQIAQKNLKARKLIADFITYNTESTTFQRISTALNAKGITAKINFVSTSPELMRQMVLNRQGMALLPDSLIKNDLKARRLVKLEGFRFERPIALVHQAGKQLSEIHLQLIATMQKSAPVKA